jgi:hypothetical protein
MIDNISLVQKYIAANNAFELNQCQCIQLNINTESKVGEFLFIMFQRTL